MNKKLLIPFNDFHHLCQSLDKVLAMIRKPDEITLLYVPPIENDHALIDYEQLYSQFKSLQARSGNHEVMLKTLIKDREPYEAVLQFAQRHQMHMILFSTAFWDCLRREKKVLSAAATHRDGQKEHHFAPLYRRTMMEGSKTAVA